MGIEVYIHTLTYAQLLIQLNTPVNELLTIPNTMSTLYMLPSICLGWQWKWLYGSSTDSIFGIVFRLMAESVDAEPTDTTVLEPKKTLSLSQALSLAANISSLFLTLSLNQKHHHKRKQWAPCLCKALLRHLPSVNWESRMSVPKPGINTRTVVHPSTVLRMLLQTNLTVNVWNTRRRYWWQGRWWVRTGENTGNTSHTHLKKKVSSTMSPWFTPAPGSDCIAFFYIQMPSCSDQWEVVVSAVNSVGSQNAMLPGHLCCAWMIRLNKTQVQNWCQNLLARHDHLFPNIDLNHRERQSLVSRRVS